MISRYSQVKREKSSLCNICQSQSQMTWDHIPPKGGIILGPVEQETVFERLTTDPKDRVYTISQNGVKFRTICSNCNNFWLGTKYDPALNEFALSTGKILIENNPLPQFIQVRCKPTAIIRAILGHLLAAKAQIDNVVLDNEIRGFFFDENTPNPSSIHVFYWIYPYSSIVILRDIVMPAVRGRFDESGFFNIIKYFPIAYLVTDLQSYEGLMELTVFRDMKTNEYADILIPLNSFKHPQWPEIVDPGNMVVGGTGLQSSILATPKRRKVS